MWSLLKVCSPLLGVELAAYKLENVQGLFVLGFKRRPIPFPELYLFDLVFFVTLVSTLIFVPLQELTLILLLFVFFLFFCNLVLQLINLILYCFQSIPVCSSLAASSSFRLLLLLNYLFLRLGQLGFTPPSLRFVCVCVRFRVISARNLALHMNLTEFGAYVVLLRCPIAAR